MENAMQSAMLQTKQWLEDIIVGLNFCPFAKKELVNNTIRYHVSAQVKLKKALNDVSKQCLYLKQHDDIETTLIVFNMGFKQFEKYLDLVDYANELIIELGFEGVFQIASFHPDYCFEGEHPDDASNYTNRSPYPTLHLIREASMARVLSVYKNPETIPENNIKLAHDKGADFFKRVLKNIQESHLS